MTLYNISELVKEFALLSNNDIKKVRKPSAKNLEMEEKWILSRLNTLIETTTSNLENYYVDVAVKEIRDFILEDFSRFYLKFAKQRAEQATKSQLKRISTITAYILHQTLLLTSIVIPFTSEYIYQDLFSKDKESIFMNKWPKPVKTLVYGELEDDFKIAKEVSNAILYLREKKNSKLRWPLKQASVETNDDAIVNSLQRMSMLIEMYTNSKSIKITKGSTAVKEIRPVYNALGPIFKQNAQEVANELKSQNADDVENAIAKDGYYSSTQRLGHLI